MTSPPVQIVWFKRDLRVRDHQPLYQAAQQGPVLPLYVVEPSVVTADDFGTRHWEFISGSLLELRQALAERGQPLVVRTGEIIEVLSALHRQLGPVALWAHEETGNHITFQRDRAVRRWAKAQKVTFRELPQNGVVRALPDRDGWAKRWEQRMTEPTVAAPAELTPAPGVAPGEIPTAEELGLLPLVGTVQRPGEQAAHEVLRSFLQQRGEIYHRALSSPVSAYEHCSRLSPHVAWRTVSMQKLESEPRIEYESFVLAYDALRADTFNEEYYAAWCAGLTGFLMVDACVRALCHTGYLNFRMRAMLVSFASYDL